MVNLLNGVTVVPVKNGNLVQRVVVVEQLIIVIIVVLMMVMLNQYKVNHGVELENQIHF